MITGHLPRIDANRRRITVAVQDQGERVCAYIIPVAVGDAQAAGVAQPAVNLCGLHYREQFRRLAMALSYIPLPKRLAVARAALRALQVSPS